VTVRDDPPQRGAAGDPDPGEIRRSPDRRSAARAVSAATSRRFGSVVVFLRFPIILLWIALAAAAVLFLPALTVDSSEGLRALVPADSPALRAEITSARRFGYPLLARTVVVQRDPNGLPAGVQANTVIRAISVTEGDVPSLRGVAGAIPITNALGFFPSSRENGTTMLTYLFFRPDESLGEQLALGQRYADELPPDAHAIAITGTVPGRLAQARLILDHQTAVEVLTVLVILVIVGIHFRSIGAPLLTVAAAGIAYEIAIHLIGWALARSGSGLPEELEPLMVVLLLGIVTDYSIFLLEHARRRLREGRTAAEAGRRSAAELVSIVGTAGIVVAFGAAGLIAAQLDTYRRLGPGLAVTVLVGLLVAITFVPAGIATFGSRLFWPSLRPSATQRSVVRRSRRFRTRLTYAATSRWIAVPVSLVGIGVLVFLAFGIRDLRLGFSLTGALPNESPPKIAALAASRGFAPGIVAPSEIVLNADAGATIEVDQLANLQRLVAGQPGVAGVVGPEQAAQLDALVRQASAIQGVEPPPAAQADLLDAMLTPGHDAARMLVILDSEPLGAPAVDTVDHLRSVLPSLVRRAGFTGGVETAVAGDTALAADTIDQTFSDLRVVGIVVLLLMFVLLAGFIRAAVAPLYLLAVSLLGFLATLGITAYVFRHEFGVVTTSFFVPFASAVLLVALGSDYNIFLVGRVWDEARSMPLREAIALAAPDASRAIAVAGITLAASFSVLAIVPIRPMQQFAFVMAVGVLLDTFFVRAMLVPALLAAVGPVSAWPGRFRRPGGETRPALEAETDEAAA
jgi:putative drug exporter of the RND superfamily